MRFRTQIAFVALSIWMVACGASPTRPVTGSKSSANSQKNPRGGSAGNPETYEPELDAEGNVIDPLANIPLDVSLTSFTEHVYKPVLSSDCSSCHFKSFAPLPESVTASPIEGAPADVTAPANIADAHKAFLELVNFNSFSGIDQVRPIAKLAAGHNCIRASDKACVDALTIAVTAWLADMEGAGYKPVAANFPNASASVALSTAQVFVPTYDANDYVGASVDQATIAAPWTRASNDIDGAITSYVSTPDTTPAANNANVQQAVTFTLAAKSAGSYDVWFRLKTKAANNSKIFVQVNNGANLAFAPLVSGDEWKWFQLVQVVNNVETPIKINVTAPGNQTLRVLFRDPGVKLGYALITKRINDFDGNLFSVKHYSVSVPLKVKADPSAKIVAIIWENTITDGKKSLGVRELRIESAEPLAIKGIKPLINGIFFSNHATYKDVDTIAGGLDVSAQVIQTGGTTSSTWIADLAKDQLSFSFDKIEKAP